MQVIWVVDLRGDFAVRCDHLIITIRSCCGGRTISALPNAVYSSCLKDSWYHTFVRDFMIVVYSVIQQVGTLIAGYCFEL